MHKRFTLTSPVNVEITINSSDDVSLMLEAHHHHKTKSRLKLAIKFALV